jgi:hypothetical protein
MSKLRQDRIESYSKPMDWVSGISTDESNLKYWAGRAKDNSYTARPRPATKTPAPPKSIESNGQKWR